MRKGLTVLVLGADGSWLTCGEAERGGADAEWCLVVEPGAILHPKLDAILLQHAAARPDVDLFYGDEVIAGSAGQSAQYRCKPSFDATLLVAMDYVGLPLAMRPSTLAALGMVAGSCGGYELAMRAVAAGLVVDRITEVLAVHEWDVSRHQDAERFAVVRKVIPGVGAELEVGPGLVPGSFELRRRFDPFPNVTVVVPTRQGAGLDGVPVLFGLLDSLAATDWPMDRLQVLIGDDGVDADWAARENWPFAVRRLQTAPATGPAFNYAAKMNRLWRAAETECLVLMNDDVLVTTPGWLKAMMTFAVDAGVGGVGARLLYPAGTIQHAGMPGGVMGLCTHAFMGAKADAPSYGDWGVMQREWSMVTGAVFATRRSVMAQVNGFDERFTLDYNDVDLCLRLRQLGFRIVYTPHAELIHRQGASRTSPPPADETALFLERWAAFLENDPAYHPRLTKITPAIEPVWSDQDWWRPLAGHLPG